MDSDKELQSQTAYLLTCEVCGFWFFSSNPQEVKCQGVSMGSKPECIDSCEIVEGAMNAPG